MVHLDVVGHQVFDFRGIDDLRDAVEQVVREGTLARVDERDMLVDDEVGVVRGAPVGGVAVEVALVPIDAANPIDARLDFNCIQHDCPFLVMTRI